MNRRDSEMERNFLFILISPQMVVLFNLPTTTRQILCLITSGRNNNSPHVVVLTFSVLLLRKNHHELFVIKLCFAIRIRPFGEIQKGRILRAETIHAHLNLASVIP